MLGSWRSKPASMRRSNPPGFIKWRGGCVCECAPQLLNPSVNDGPSGGAVGKPRSNCHAEGDEPARSRVQGSVETPDFIFLAASMDRAAREVCALLMPALQAQARLKFLKLSRGPARKSPADEK